MRGPAGKRCRNATAENALSHVLGYSVSNDVSSRHWQRFCNQWVKGKSFDTFCPIGPVLVTPEVIPDPGAHSCPSPPAVPALIADAGVSGLVWWCADKLGISSRLNGTTMQNSNTADQIFSCVELIVWASKDMTLLPGTVIMTGTPEGIGAAMDPARFMVPGDVIECEIEGLGTLRNPVVQAPLDGVTPAPE